jgi:CDP-glucose 4,6-dehydratase
VIDASFWRDRPVFLTGHTGFKGAWLTLWLARMGARVTGYSLAPETTPNLFDRAGVVSHCHSIIGDIRDSDALRRAMEAAEPEIVLHLAAQALVRRSYREPIETFASNVMGTVNCLDAVRHTPSVRATVVVTSDKCYENKGWEWAYRENEPMGGHDPYSSSKGCSELVAAAYRSSFFDDEGTSRVATARAGNVIGGGDWSEDRLIPDMIRAFTAHRSVEIRAPASTRPWQHVLEPLHGYLRLAEVLAGQDGRSYADGWNFGPVDADCRPVSYIVDRLANGWGQGAAWHLSEVPQPYEANVLKVDASKARARLGWAPRLDLDQALDWTIDWYRAFDGGDAAALCIGQIDRFIART